jgi:hypothetical protein
MPSVTAQQSTKREAYLVHWRDLLDLSRRIHVDDQTNRVLASDGRGNGRGSRESCLLNRELLDELEKLLAVLRDWHAQDMVLHFVFLALPSVERHLDGEGSPTSRLNHPQ